MTGPVAIQAWHRENVRTLDAPCGRRHQPRAQRSAGGVPQVALAATRPNANEEGTKEELRAGALSGATLDFCAEKLTCTACKRQSVTAQCDFSSENTFRAFT